MVEKLVGSRVLFIDSYSATSLRVGWSGYSIVKAAAQMAAEEILPVVELFQQLDADGEINGANTIGQYVVDILLNATSDELAEREFWDFNNINDQIFMK